MKHFYPIKLFQRAVFGGMFVLCAGLLAAQTTVSGRITDQADGGSLPGVTVRIKNGTGGAVADFDGNYQIQVPSSDAVLQFSYTGYATKEIAVGDQTTLNVALSLDAAVLDQVVVVGYGTQQKSDLTGSVGSVKAKDIERIAVPSIDQALQGKIAGVYVTPISGEPGRAAVVRIRGTGTLNNSNPIYVVDGMITYDASFVNPLDVASIEVLKDASACAIYGARGSNGVIIITTKNGKKREKPVVSFSAYTGTQEITRQLDMMNASEFAETYNILTNSNYFPNPAALGEGTNWQDEIFRKAPFGNVQLAVNGGSEKYSYNISGNVFDQSGVLLNSEFRRATVRFNNEFQVSKWLTLGNNLAFSSSKTQNAAGGAVGSAYRVSPTIPVRDSTGDFADPTSPFGLAVGNPAAELEYGKHNFNRINRFFGTVYGDVRFLKYFKFRSNFGFDLRNGRARSFLPKYEVSNSQVNRDDRLAVEFNEGRDWIWEQTLTFDREFGGQHRLNVLAGFTAEERGYEFLTGRRSNFVVTSDPLLYLDQGDKTTQFNSGGASVDALNSYLFRTNYSFMGRYLFTFSMRHDASSRFLSANRAGLFPSFSVGWNAGQESFIEDLGVFERLKLRASYGNLGNQNSVPTQRNPVYTILSVQSYAVFGPEEKLQQGVTFTTLGNADLKWETARQTDFGLEFGLLGGRLTGEVDWFRRLTDNIISSVPIPDYVGSPADPIVNTASVKNTGWDITLNYRQAGKFSWNVGAIFSPVQNEVTKINDQKSEILAAFYQGEAATRTAVGLPIGAFYGYQVEGIFQTAEEAQNAPRIGNETAGDLRFKDLDGNGIIDSDDKTYLGSPIPKLTYGFTAGFDFAGFDFAADVFGVSGNKVFNTKQTFRFSVYNWEKKFYDGWTEANPSTTTPRITNGGHNYRISDFFLEDGSFLRLRNVTLGYSLPQNALRRLHLTKFRVFVSGQNLWTRQQYSGYSPEFADPDSPFTVGFDNSPYPIAKSVQGGVEVSF